MRFGFVDVPGHERFVSNMLAGAAGIDVLLLVIAADESVKPQTREHFDICRLLGVKRGVVALTKSDMVDSETLELVRMEAEEFLRGSFLEKAPLVAVSAKTGAGLGELKKALTEAAENASAKDAARYFRLPIDRAFAMKGFGSVVTGTLISGSVGPMSRSGWLRIIQHVWCPGCYPAGLTWPSFALRKARTSGWNSCFCFTRPPSLRSRIIIRSPRKSA